MVGEQSLVRGSLNVLDFVVGERDQKLKSEALGVLEGEEITEKRGVESEVNGVLLGLGEEAFEVGELVEDGPFADLAEQGVGEAEGFELVVPLEVDDDDVESAEEERSLVVFRVSFRAAVALLERPLDSLQRQQRLLEPAQPVLREGLQDQQVVALQAAHRHSQAHCLLDQAYHLRVVLVQYRQHQLATRAGLLKLSLHKVADLPYRFTHALTVLSQNLRVLLLVQHEESSEGGVGGADAGEGALQVSGEQLALGLVSEGRVVGVVDGEGGGELEDGLFVVAVEHEDDSPGVEVVGDVIFGLLDGAVDILEGLCVHPQIQVQSGSVEVQVCVLPCFQTLLDQLQNLHEALSVYGLLQELFVEDHCSVEKRLRPQQLRERLFEAPESLLPLSELVGHDALADADVVGGSGGISIGLVGQYQLVELEGRLMVPEAEVAVGQRVVEQVSEKWQMVGQFVLEVDFARAHEHEGLGVLLLHQESESLGQLEELVGDLRLYLGKQSAFEVGQRFVEISLLHAEDGALGDSFAEHFGGAVSGEQLVVEHKGLLLPGAALEQLGLEQRALRSRAGCHPLQLAEQLQSLREAASARLDLDLLQVQLLELAWLVQALPARPQQAQSLVLPPAPHQRPRLQQPRSRMPWILAQDCVQILQRLRVVSPLQVHFGPVKKPVLTTLSGLQVLADRSQARLLFPQLLTAHRHQKQQLRFVLPVALLDLPQMFQALAVAAHIEEGQPQPIVEFRVVAIVVESTGEDLGGLGHAIATVVLAAPPEQVCEVAHFERDGPVLREVGEAADIPVELLGRRDLP